MAIREDVVASAVSFLTNPKVQESPLARRIAFLESKNLTNEEIEVALARSKTGGATTTTAAAPAVPSVPSSAVVMHHGHSHAVAQPQPGWLATASWKDLVLATGAAAAAGYGIYTVAKTHIAPYVAWATPASLATDRAAFETQIKSTEESLKELREQTAAMSASFEKQKADLERTLASVESAINAASSAVTAREAEARRIEEEVDKLKAFLPVSLENFKQEQKNVLNDVQNEFKSLKAMLLNRRTDAVPLPSAGAPMFGAQPASALSSPSPSIPAWQMQTPSKETATVAATPSVPSTPLAASVTATPAATPAAASTTAASPTVEAEESTPASS